jgi:hypothetical protein
MAIAVLAAALVAAPAYGEDNRLRASELIGERVVGRYGGLLGEIAELRLDVRLRRAAARRAGRSSAPAARRQSRAARRPLARGVGAA